MRAIRKLCCYSCKKRIGAHKPDLALDNFATGTPRYFHIRCDEAIAKLVLEESALYHLMIRYIEAERN